MTTSAARTHTASLPKASVAAAVAADPPSRTPAPFLPPGNRSRSALRWAAPVAAAAPPAPSACMPAATSPPGAMPPQACWPRASAAAAAPADPPAQCRSRHHKAAARCRAASISAWVEAAAAAAMQARCSCSPTASAQASRSPPSAIKPMVCMRRASAVVAVPGAAPKTAPAINQNRNTASAVPPAWAAVGARAAPATACWSAPACRARWW